LGGKDKKVEAVDENMKARELKKYVGKGRFFVRSKDTDAWNYGILEPTGGKDIPFFLKCRGRVYIPISGDTEYEVRRLEEMKEGEPLLFC
jgi:hypothetical protein